MNRTAGRSPEPPRMEVRPIPGQEGYYATSEGTVIGKKGKEIGSLMKALGYTELRLSNNEKFYRHEIVAFVFLGPRPEGFQIDHIDQNKQNDCPDNLRYVPRWINQHNRGMNKNNKTGIKGLLYTCDKRWRACIEKEGIRYIKFFHHTKRQEAIQWLRTTREQLGLPLE